MTLPMPTMARALSPRAILRLIDLFVFIGYLSLVSVVGLDSQNQITGLFLSVLRFR